MQANAGALLLHALQRGVLDGAVPVGEHKRLKLLLSPVCKLVGLHPAQEGAVSSVRPECRQEGSSQCWPDLCMAALVRPHQKIRTSSVYHPISTWNTSTSRTVQSMPTHSHICMCAPCERGVWEARDFTANSPATTGGLPQEGSLTGGRHHLGHSAAAPSAGCRGTPAGGPGTPQGSGASAHGAPQRHRTPHRLRAGSFPFTACLLSIPKEALSGCNHIQSASMVVTGKGMRFWSPKGRSPEAITILFPALGESNRITNAYVHSPAALFCGSLCRGGSIG